jgi:shikimate kinase/3-dehydroquinate synthase
MANTEAMRRPLLLNGFMGVGKSTVGREVAVRAGRPFIDLDDRVEAELGCSIADYFSRSGEAAFRAVEREVFLRVFAAATASAEPPVVALGGGTLLSREPRLRAVDEAVVVTLEAAAHEIVQRVSGNEARPLLKGSLTIERVQELLEVRAHAYAEAHARFSTTGRKIDHLAVELLEVWKRDPVGVAAGVTSYSVEFGRNFAASRIAAFTEGSPAALITDKNVGPLHAAPFQKALAAAGQSPAVVVLEAGEAHKHVQSVERIWKELLAVGADRRTLCVGLGGGVVTDITGFTASTWMRGVRWVGVPTTLLAMVDASVGGKTGVDLGPAKNAVGAFWQPAGVLCDVALEATEPVREYRSALAEVVKTAVIGDPALFELLEARVGAVNERDPAMVEEMVRRCVRVKARIVSADEREAGLRAVLNLGHTVGHALEAQGGYGRLTHGEAVSLGLVAALRLGVRLGVTPKELETRVKNLLDAIGLPTNLGGEPLEGAAGLVGHDKKRKGSKLRFVFAHDLGRVDTQDLELDALRREVVMLA